MLEEGEFDIIGNMWKDLSLDSRFDIDIALLENYLSKGIVIFYIYSVLLDDLINILREGCYMMIHIIENSKI